MAKKNGKEKLQFQENRALGKQFARAFIQVLFDLCLHYLLPEPAEVLCAAHIEPVVYNYQQTPSNRRIVYRPRRVNHDRAHHIKGQPNYVYYQVDNYVKLEQFHLVGDCSFSKEPLVFVYCTCHSFTYSKTIQNNNNAFERFKGNGTQWHPKMEFLHVELS